MAPGKSPATPIIRLSKGVRLRIALQDTGGLLDRSEPRPNEKLVMTIGVPGFGYSFMNVVDKSPTGRVYEMLVPRQRSVKLRLASSDFAIADTAGRAVAASTGHSTDIAIPASGPPPNLTFRVTGVQPK